MFETYPTDENMKKSVYRHEHNCIKGALEDWQDIVNCNYSDLAVLQNSETCQALIWNRKLGKATGALIEHLPEGLTPEQICEALLSAEGEV